MLRKNVNILSIFAIFCFCCLAESNSISSTNKGKNNEVDVISTFDTSKIDSINDRQSVEYHFLNLIHYKYNFENSLDSKETEESLKINLPLSIFGPEIELYDLEFFMSWKLSNDSFIEFRLENHFHNDFLVFGQIDFSGGGGEGTDEKDSFHCQLRVDSDLGKLREMAKNWFWETFLFLGDLQPFLGYLRPIFERPYRFWETLGNLW